MLHNTQPNAYIYTSIKNAYIQTTKSSSSAASTSSGPLTKTSNLGILTVFIKFLLNLYLEKHEVMNHYIWMDICSLIWLEEVCKYGWKQNMFTC